MLEIPEIPKKKKIPGLEMGEHLLNIISGDPEPQLIRALKDFNHISEFKSRIKVIDEGLDYVKERIYVIIRRVESKCFKTTFKELFVF